MRACMRNSLDSSICSSTSQRTLLSEDRPWARIICTCASMSASDTISLPTMATVLSIKPPSYLCAKAAVQQHDSAAAAASTMIVFLICQNK